MSVIGKSALIYDENGKSIQKITNEVLVDNTYYLISFKNSRHLMRLSIAEHCRLELRDNQLLHDNGFTVFHGVKDDYIISGATEIRGVLVIKESPKELGAGPNYKLDLSQAYIRY